MIGQNRRGAVALTRRQKRLLLGGLLAALIAAGLAVYLVSRSSTQYATSAHGCVNVQVAGSTGGATLHECGAAARRWCRAESTRHDALARAAQPQCVLAGVRFAGAGP